MNQMRIITRTKENGLYYTKKTYESNMIAWRLN
jgi:hypothetical protein